MKKVVFTLMLLLTTLAGTAQNNIYSFSAVNDEGKNVSLNDYRGKVLLVVNTATRCGFTPQYKELEDIYKKCHADGFEILDFPCNQFGQQAPGSIEEIHQFCTANFDIQFQQGGRGTPFALRLMEMENGGLRMENGGLRMED